MPGTCPITTRLLQLSVLTLFLFSIKPALASTQLNVLVTIRPLYSLVAAVMQGVNKPVLLLNTTQSPHHINLRPSDYRKLAHADIVFWAGPAMETFMPALIQKYSSRKKFIALMQAKGIERLAIRPVHTSAHKLLNNKATNNKIIDNKIINNKIIDPHFWLSSANARQIVKTVTQTLIHLDKNHTSIYLKNQQQTLDHINRLHTRLKIELNGLKTPFISYHDAYQYFEKDYQLKRLASVNLNEETNPGIKQIRYIKDLIKKYHVPCVFYEAPFKPPLINTLINHTSAKAVELDILGLHHPADQFLWFDMLKQTGHSIAKCLNKQEH